MEIRNITQSPHFGMALRIKPEAVATLNEATRQEIELLQKAGEALKDTKFFHLEIGEDGKRIIVSPYANKYKGGTIAVDEPTDEFLKYHAIWEGPESGGMKKGNYYHSAIKFENKDAATKAYQDLIASNSDIEQDVKMVKYLDAGDERKAIQDMVVDLYKKYGE